MSNIEQDLSSCPSPPSEALSPYPSTIRPVDLIYFLTLLSHLLPISVFICSGDMLESAACPLGWEKGSLRIVLLNVASCCPCVYTGERTEASPHHSAPVA